MAEQPGLTVRKANQIATLKGIAFQMEINITFRFTVQKKTSAEAEV